MLGAADIEAWDDDIRAEVEADLRRAGWHLEVTGEARTTRMRRLLGHFRVGRRLTVGELTELRDALIRG